MPRPTNGEKGAEAFSLPTLEDRRLARRGRLQERRPKKGQTDADREAFKRRVDGFKFQDLFESLSEQQRVELDAALKEAFLSLPFLRRLHNSPPTPAQVIAELDAVAQRLIDASVYLRNLRTTDMLDEMIQRIGRERLGYEALKSPGQRPRRHKDRGLQVLACSIERHLRTHYFSDMPERMLRRLILKVLDRAGEGLADDRARNVDALFSPSPTL